MTNKNQKTKIRERMAATGEPHAEARRHVIEARPRRQPGAEPEKIHVRYTLQLDGDLEFDAAAWNNALSNERRRLVEEAVGEQLDADFELYGGLGIAECVDGGELEFTIETDAERAAELAEFDAEAIETAMRTYAGIGEYDDWPADRERPSVSDSHVTVHEGVEYVVLRRQRNIMAVYDIAGGAYKALATWPKEVGRR
jgi:hypothetical protein